MLLNEKEDIANIIRETDFGQYYERYFNLCVHSILFLLDS